MARLVTVQQAVRALRLPDEMIDEASEHQLDTAEYLCLRYVKQRRSNGEAWAAEVDAWDPHGPSDMNPPPPVVAGIIAMFGYIRTHQGDDYPSDEPTQKDGQLPYVVRMYLDPHRDPTIA